MQRTLFRCGNSVVVSLPRDALVKLGWSPGTQVTVTLDQEGRRIIVSSGSPPASGVDEPFVRQFDEFVARYGEALRALAR